MTESAITRDCQPEPEVNLRHQRKNTLTTALLLGLFAHGALAQLANERELDDYLMRQVDETKIPGLVALVTDSEGVIYERAFGMADEAGQRAMTPDTIFRIASMTKPIAATIIAMAADDGKLGLDEPITRYLPDFTERGVIAQVDLNTGAFTRQAMSAAPEIRQMLSHSSGLAYGFASNAITAITSADDAPPADRVPLLYEPGTSWSYSGGIAIVGNVLERIEGKGLDSLMDERLFEPLGMSDTSFIVPSGKHNRVATTHRLDGNDRLQEDPNPVDIRSAVSGDGGLHSTASDYAKFIRLILNDGIADDGTRLLAGNVIRALKTNQLAGFAVTLQDSPTPALARQFPLGAGRDGFGLGFQITGDRSNNDERAPGSLSWAGIFNTEFWIDPERGIGGVLLMQYLPFYDDDAIETLIGFEQRVYAGLDQDR